MKTKKLLTIAIIGTLAVSSMGNMAFAATTNTTQNVESKKFGKGERPEKPENVVFGKITAISENSVTVSLAEMKMPDGMMKDGARCATPPEMRGERPDFKNGEKPDFKDGEKPDFKDGEKLDFQNGERPDGSEERMNVEDRFTLTGTSKTYNIKNATFDNFGMRGQKKESTENSDTTTKAEKTYKDFQVGDYVAIELESSTSTEAKSMREVGMMRGMGPRGGMMHPKENTQSQ